MADIPTSILWAQDEGYRGFDVHIVRGSAAVSTTALKGFVKMTTDDNLDAQEIPASGPGAPLSFDFESNIGPDPTTLMSNFGFTFNKTTGQVTVAPTATSRVVRNFILIAVVTFSNAGPFRLPIRVHIHTSRVDVRLAPNPLHLRQGTALRLSVLAAFDDAVLNTVGNISYHPGVNFDVSGDIIVAQDPHPTDPRRGFKDGGFIGVKPNSPASSGVVTVRLPDYLGPAVPPGQGTANVSILPGWGSLPTPAGGPNPYRAELIGGGPGVAKRADPRVRNVLFLPEGFLENEMTLFKEITDTLVMKELRFSSVLRPFDIVSKKINFFRVWIKPHSDVAQAGITEQSVLNPSFDMDGAVGKTRGHLIPTPIEPERNATGTTLPLKSLTTPTKKTTAIVLDELLPRLLFRVGLPVVGTSKNTLAEQLAEWNRIYGSGFLTFDPSVTAALQEKLFRKWVVLGQQVMTLDIDTVFSMASYETPKVTEDSKVRVLTFHPLRFTRDDLDAYVSKVEAQESNGNVVTIGNELWVQSVKPVGTRNIPNKDLKLLIFVCRGQRRQGTNAPSGDPVLLRDGESGVRVHITISTAAHSLPLLENVNQLFAKTKPEDFQHFGGDLVFPVFPVATLAHEMAHTISCGDEYGPFSSSPTPVVLGELDTDWNLQDPSELNDPTLPLAVSAIRWLWPRAAAAGFMASGISQVTGNNLSVDMEPGQSNNFATNDPVRFRPAELLSRPAAGGPLRYVPPTFLFVVQARDKTNRNRLLIKLEDPAKLAEFLNNNTSAAGMILYKPHLDASKLDNLIIHQKMIDHLETNGVLTRAAQAPCVPSANTTSDRQIPVHVPPELKARNKAMLIGLFDGGALFRCGILHATGFCMMRRSATLDSSNRSIANTLCHVCRYIIVDQLDPSGHFDIDKELKMPEFKP